MNDDLILWIGIVIWIFSGIFSYGYLFSLFQNKFPTTSKKDYKEDIIFCFIFSFIGGVVTLIFIYLTKGYKYGLKFH